MPTRTVGRETNGSTPGWGKEEVEVWADSEVEVLAEAAASRRMVTGPARDCGWCNLSPDVAVRGGKSRPENEPEPQTLGIIKSWHFPTPSRPRSVTPQSLSGTSHAVVAQSTSQSPRLRSTLSTHPPAISIMQRVGLQSASRALARQPRMPLTRMMQRRYVPYFPHKKLQAKRVRI